MSGNPALSVRRYGASMLTVSVLVYLLCGCQSTREAMIADGYPAPFVDGFETGCSSGRQAAGALADFRKDVPRYLQQPLYAQGWDDGFRQCQVALESAIERELHDSDRRDREWRRHVDQAMAKALRSS